MLLLSGEFKAVTLLEDGLVRAGAGASLASVCRFAQEHSLTGLEFAWGIPGSVGGAAYMDAGAYGGEMKDVVERVRHLTPPGRRGKPLGRPCSLPTGRAATPAAGTSSPLWSTAWPLGTRPRFPPRWRT